MKILNQTGIMLIRKTQSGLELREQTCLFEPQMLTVMMLIEKDNLALNTETEFHKVRLYEVAFSRGKSRVK